MGIVFGNYFALYELSDNNFITKELPTMYSPRSEQKLPKKYDYSSLTGKYSITPTSSSLLSEKKSFLFPTTTEFPTNAYSPQRLTEKLPDTNLKHSYLTQSITVKPVSQFEPHHVRTASQQDALDRSSLIQRNQELETQLSLLLMKMKKIEESKKTERAQIEKVYEEIIRNLSKDKSQIINQLKNDFDQSITANQEIIDCLFKENEKLEQELQDQDVPSDMVLKTEESADTNRSGIKNLQKIKMCLNELVFQNNQLRTKFLRTTKQGKEVDSLSASAEDFGRRSFMSQAERTPKRDAQTSKGYLESSMAKSESDFKAPSQQGKEGSQSLDEKDKKVVALENYVNSLLKENESLQEGVQKERARNADFEALIARLQQENEALKQEKTRAEDLLNNWKLTKAKEQDPKELEQTIDSLKLKVSELTNEAETSKSLIEKLKDSILQKDTEIKALETRENDFKEEMHSLQEQISKLDLENKEMSVQLHEMPQLYKTRENELTEKINSLENQISDLENEKKELAAQVEAIPQVELENQIEFLKEQLHKQQEGEAYISKLQDDNDFLTNSLEQKNKEVIELHQLIESKTQSIENLQNKLHHEEKAAILQKDEIERLKGELEHHESQLQEKEEQINNVKAMYEEEIRSLKAEKHELTEEIKQQALNHAEKQKHDLHEYQKRIKEIEERTLGTAEETISQRLKEKTQEIDELNAEVEKLREEVRTHKLEFERLEGELQEQKHGFELQLQLQKEEAERHQSDLMNQLESAITTAHSQREETAELWNAENAAAKEKEAQWQLQLEEQKREIVHEYEEKLATKAHEIENLESSIKTLEARVNEETLQSKDLTQKLTQMASEYENLRAELSRMEQAKLHLEQENEDLHHEKEQLEQKTSTLSKEKSELEGEVHQLKIKEAKFEHETLELNEKIAISKTREDQLKEQFRKAKEELKKLKENSNPTSQQDLDDTKKLSAQLEQEKRALAEELNKVKNQESESQSTIKTLQEKLSNIESKHYEECEKLNQQIAELTTQMKEESETIKQFYGSLAHEEGYVSLPTGHDLKDIISGLQQIIQKLYQDLSAATEARDSAVSEAQKLQDEMNQERDAAAEDKLRLLDKVNANSKLIEELKRKALAAENQRDEAKLELEAKRKELERAKGAQEALEKELRANGDKSAVALAENHELRQKLEKSEHSLSDLQQRLEKQNQSGDEMSKHISNLKREYEQKLQESDAAIASLRKENEELVKSHEAALGSTKKQFGLELQAAEQQKKELEAKVNELEQMVKSQAKGKQLIEDLKNKYKEKENEYKAEIASVNEALEKAKKREEAAREEVKGLREKLESMENDVAGNKELQNQLEEKEQLMDELQERIIQLTGDIAGVRDLHASQIEDLQNQITEKDQYLTELQSKVQELEDLKNQFGSVVVERERLVAENSRLLQQIEQLGETRVVETEDFVFESSHKEQTTERNPVEKSQQEVEKSSEFPDESKEATLTYTEMTHSPKKPRKRRGEVEKSSTFHPELQEKGISEENTTGTQAVDNNATSLTNQALQLQLLDSNEPDLKLDPLQIQNKNFDWVTYCTNIQKAYERIKSENAVLKKEYEKIQGSYSEATEERKSEPQSRKKRGGGTTLVKQYVPKTPTTDIESTPKGLESSFSVGKQKVEIKGSQTCKADEHEKEWGDVVSPTVTGSRKPNKSKTTKLNAKKERQENLEKTFYEKKLAELGNQVMDLELKLKRVQQEAEAKNSERIQAIENDFMEQLKKYKEIIKAKDVELDDLKWNEGVRAHNLKKEIEESVRKEFESMYQNMSKSESKKKKK